MDMNKERKRENHQIGNGITKRPFKHTTYEKEKLKANAYRLVTSSRWLLKLDSKRR